MEKPQTASYLLVLKEASEMHVIIDSCVVDLLAKCGADPVNDLHGTEFTIAYTSDLKEEYIRAAHKENLPKEVRDLHARILDAGIPLGFFGFDGGPCLGLDEGILADSSQIAAIESIPTKERQNNPIPKNRTDAHMVALARDAIVITNNSRQSHWRAAPHGTGCVIMWKNFKEALDQKKNIASALRRFL